jgi:hypothetical protein
VTTPPVPDLLNNNTVVTVAWIASIPGFTTDMAGPQLPPDVNPDGSPAAWLQTGYITCNTVGGTPDDLLPVHRPVMEIKCWAAVPGSDYAPWLVAEGLAARITVATWSRRRIPRPLRPVITYPAAMTGGVQLPAVTYPPAVVRSAYFAQEFRRLYGDQGDYAVLQADLALEWTSPTQPLD